MFRVIGQLRLYFDPTGLAAARMDVRALRVVIIPALAMETVCCSCDDNMVRKGRGKAERSEEWPNHHFMKYTSRRVRHLIKLVDTAHSSIGED